METAQATARGAGQPGPVGGGVPGASVPGASVPVVQIRRGPPLCAPEGAGRARPAWWVVPSTAWVLGMIGACLGAVADVEAWRVDNVPVVAWSLWGALMGLCVGTVLGLVWWRRARAVADMSLTGRSVAVDPVPFEEAARRVWDRWVEQGGWERARAMGWPAPSLRVVWHVPVDAPEHPEGGWQARASTGPRVVVDAVFKRWELDALDTIAVPVVAARPVVEGGGGGDTALGVRPVGEIVATITLPQRPV